MTAADNTRYEVLADLLADLDRRATAQGDALDRLGETVTESTDLLAQTLPRLDTLAEQVAELRGHTTGAGGTTSGSDDGPVRGVVWETLTADQAVEEWTRLAAWVADVLGPWYDWRRGHLPDCWALHRPVVRRLSALHTAYLAAHTGPAASAAASADWHDRWLPHTQGLIIAEEPLASSRRKLNERSGLEWNCEPGRHDGADATGRPLVTDDGRPLTGKVTRKAPVKDRHGSDTIQVVWDPIHPDHWGPFWRRAVDQDVAQRRAREEAG